MLLLRWRSSVVPRGTRRPLAGVCWSGPTPGSIRSSPAPPVGACGLRQPSPRCAAVPGAAAATASWCGDRCCCRYGPLRQLCGRDLRALAAPARCPEAALPARHSRQRRRHRRLDRASAGQPAARARGQLESREPEIRGKSPRARVREAGGGRGGGRGRPKRYLAATGRPCCLPPAQGHSGGPISPASGGQKTHKFRFCARALDVVYCLSLGSSARPVFMHGLSQIACMSRPSIEQGI